MNWEVGIYEYRLYEYACECLAQEISYLSAGESIGETPFS